MNRAGRSLLSLIAAALLPLPAACRADFVIRVTADPATIAQGIGGAFQQVAGVSWTMDRAYTNLTISAAIATANPGDIATAYLTTKAGAGTTAADVIAQRTFALPTFLPLRSAPNFDIFSGLTLAPGTYFLILTTPFDASQARGWRGTSSTPSVLLAPGVTLNPSLLSADAASNPSFAPASTFSVSNNTYQFSVLSVPEPSSLALLSVACFSAASWHSIRRSGRWAKA